MSRAKVMRVLMRMPCWRFELCWCRDPFALVYRKPGPGPGLDLYYAMMVNEVVLRCLCTSVWQGKWSSVEDASAAIEAGCVG